MPQAARVVAMLQFRATLRGGGIPLAAVVLLLVTGGSAWFSVHRAQNAASLRTEVQTRARRQWEQQGKKDPHSAAHFGMYAVKPLTAWYWFDSGVDPFLGTATFIEAHRQNTPTASGTDRRDWQRLLTMPTPAAIAQILLPLLAILCGFGCIAADRESGILRQVLSGGVAPGTFGLGKLAGATGVLALVAAPVMASIAVGGVLTGADPAGALLLGGAYLIYSLIFLLLSVAVSARASTSAASLVFLLSFWLLVSVIAPRVLSSVTSQMLPAPPYDAFWEQVHADQENGVDGHDDQNLRTEQLRQSVLTQYGVARVDDLPVNFRGLALQAGEDYGNRVFDRRYRELWDLYHAQDRLQGLLGIISPQIPLHRASMVLAGTDLAEYERFSRAVESYRRVFVGQLNGELAASGRGASVARGNDFWSSVPRFDYRAARSPVGLPLAGLLAWFLLAGLLAWRSLAGMRP
jgi:ABC-2 type transport system permease protein